MSVKNPLVFSTALTSAMTANQTTLPVSDEAIAKLKDLLGESDHTYLMLNSGVDVEVIKVEVVMEELYITRSTSGSFAFPAGTCVKFTMTDEYMRDFVCSMPAECVPTPIVDDCGDNCC